MATKAKTKIVFIFKEIKTYIKHTNLRDTPVKLILIN